MYSAKQLKVLADFLTSASADYDGSGSFSDALNSSDIETTIEAEWPAHPDFLAPNFDRSNRSGNFIVVWLSPNGPIVSDRCPDYWKAKALTTQHRQFPAWIARGTEDQINAFVLSLDHRDPHGFSPQTLGDQLRSVLEIKAAPHQENSSRD